SGHATATPPRAAITSRRLIVTGMVALPCECCLVKGQYHTANVRSLRSLRLVCLNLAVEVQLLQQFRPTLVGRGRPSLGGTAAQQWTPQQRAACEPDAMRLCQQYISDIGRVRSCMSHYRRYLSPACRAVFQGGAKKGGRRFRR